MPEHFNASLVDEVLDIRQNDAENTMHELPAKGDFLWCQFWWRGSGALRWRARPGSGGGWRLSAIAGDRYLSTGVFGEEHFA